MNNPIEKRPRLVIGRTVSIREKVYDVIRNGILNGRIAPGDRMVETRLAKQIKTSRTPVREALHMLEMEGLLEAIPRVGYRVKQSKQDIQRYAFSEDQKTEKVVSRGKNA
jgi:DNA-binding GntR family transcriptional regulator